MVIRRHHELSAYLEGLAHMILLTLSCLLFKVPMKWTNTLWGII